MIYDIRLVSDAEGYDVDHEVNGGLIVWKFIAPSVAQRVQQALKLLQGTWFLDLRDGMPWQDLTLANSKTRIDANIRRKVLSVDGVTGITSYRSVMARNVLSVEMLITSDGGPERVFVDLKV